MTATLRVELSFPLGDTWAASEAWALLIGDADVDLTDGWGVTAQARATDDATVLAEWSTANGRIALGRADVELEDGTTIETSTVQLRHSAAVSSAWQPFVADFDCQVERGIGADVERYTIASGTIRALRETTRA